MRKPSLDDLLLIMRSHGVRRFKLGDIEIEFSTLVSRPDVALTEMMMDSETLEPQQCRCGHDLCNHSEHGCLQCSGEQCVAPEAEA